MAGRTITTDGIGGLEALRIFGEVLAPACVSIDHPRFLSFVPSAPTEAATLFDLVVGAGGMFGGTWLESSGAVFAENEALRWLADLAGLPPSAGGVFVSGGSAANLSALVVARRRWRDAEPGREGQRPLIVTSTGAHSSVDAAARVMDADVVAVPADERGRATGDADAGRSRDAVGRRAPRGSPPSWPPPARRTSAWSTTWPASPSLAADLAPGTTSTPPTAAPRWPCRAPARCSTASSGRTASSSIRTSGSSPRSTAPRCSTGSRRSPGRRTPSTPSTSTWSPDRPDWNPSDYAYHLSRRARGLPFWFSLATHGTGGLPGGDRGDARPRSRRGRPRRRGRAHRARPRAGPVDRPVPAGRMVARPTTTPGATRALDDGLAFVVPDVVAGRDRAAVLLREPAHHARRRPGRSSTRWPDCSPEEGSAVPPRHELGQLAQRLPGVVRDGYRVRAPRAPGG